MSTFGKKQVLIVVVPILFMLAGCGQNLAPSSDQPIPIGKDEERKRNFGNLFGDDFLSFGGARKDINPGNPSSSVNPFIWRASLDTLSFMPLSSADAIGGVIVTDWYIASHNSKQRLKVIVYVMNAQLRSDAIKVTVYKQVFKEGTWVNGVTDAGAATEMENIILSKARQLRVKYREDNKQI
jgi:hypothetical protein